MTVEYSGINKANVREIGDPNSLTSLSGMIRDAPKIPSLLSEVVPVKEEMINTKTFQHDSLTTGVDEIKDSAYHDRGDQVSKETGQIHTFAIPHWAQQGRIKPSDIVGRREYGTENLDNLNRHQGRVLAQFNTNWSSFEELSLASVITTGLAYTPNSTIPAYDFYQEYTGTAAASRPTTNFNLASADPRVGGEVITENILNATRPGDNVTDIICFCGKTFFDGYVNNAQFAAQQAQRVGIEGQDPLIQELRRFGPYRMFRGADGILYVRYSGMIGTKLIADGDAYFMPRGNLDMFRRIYAPAETMAYANTMAQKQYAWSKVDEFEGGKYFTESNQLTILVNPDLVQKGTAA